MFEQKSYNQVTNPAMRSMRLKYLSSLYHVQALFLGTVSVAQLCLTLCDPMDSSLPSSSVHGILQARILEWGAISFSGGSS